MSKIEIYTRPGCGYCSAARNLLKARSLSFTEYDVYAEPEKKAELSERINYSTYPQIFINSQSIGGFDDLALLDRQVNLQNSFS
jgi:glutaredoxin 3